MRKFAKNHPDKAVVCPRCDTPLMKRSFAEHLKSNKCKDIHCIVKGTGGCIDDPQATNEKVIEIYEKNEPLPEVELNADNYYHHNLFNGE
jgi:molybdopterin-guanine dinucleotide biosynthesis protein A